MKITRLFIVSLLCVGLYIGLDTPWGRIPALGKLLNPFEGFWQNAEPKQIPDGLNLDLKGLQAKVDIVFDDRLVPHVFAQNDHDVYFAQGYITAKYRLWQMEIQTRAAAGRLSEILGEDLLEHDLEKRRRGMLMAAENSLKGMIQDERTRNAIEAYSKGVNAYIRSLKPKDYPIEYKLLGYAPEEWTPLKSALLLKMMAADLSLNENDLENTNILRKYGKKVVDQLFPNYPNVSEPIIPVGTKWDFQPVNIPKKPEKYSIIPEKIIPSKKEKNAENKNAGSNNWAISAEKSATGYPILANDPHLNLQLPSIWFEIQLVTPDMNVYGVSIPGAPCVIIGFNKEVAWGVTNVESDVLDWYQIKFKDNSLKSYWHDNTWKPTQQRVEKIYLKGKKEPKIDTLILTHHGVVVAKPNEIDLATNWGVPIGAAMRWTAFEVGNELLTFYLLNRARNYEDYRNALKSYVCPSQNFIFADVNKDIAITSNGKLPLKWKEQGRFILDGSNPQHDWQGWIPYEHLPTIKNPARGFVSSANQFPADTTYPYYLHSDFASYYRAKRINERLTQMTKATPDSLRMLQNDNVSVIAREVLPKLLSYLNKETLKNNFLKAFEFLKTWNYAYNAEDIAPTIFQNWWLKIEHAIWNDDFGNAKNNADAMRFPATEKTIQLILLNDSLPSPWFDDVNTIEKEDLRLIINRSFQQAIEQLEKECGKTISEKWQWGRYKNTTIRHIARIPAFGREGILIGGNKNIINATASKSGASWRMVVALGKKPQGYGIYPAGQSGNPGSFYYDNFIETWQKGELAPLLFLQKPNDLHERIKGRIILN
ncbi:MAG: penicillin acylase family protein [Microscillaceae bacterium]|nr:penicillin acylase family protein [Microscillaceae bacterium]MDW8461668.1 penicillin acylase family protein [Cytophagales bacterium]